MLQHIKDRTIDENTQNIDTIKLTENLNNLKIDIKNDENKDELNTLIDKYIDINVLNDDEDTLITKKLCKLLYSCDSVDCKVMLKLVTAISSHLTDHRIYFNERGKVLATVLFKKDDFNIKKLSVYEEFKEYIPQDIKNNDNELIELHKNDTDIFGAYVENDINILKPTHKILFIQQAIKVLRSSSNRDEIISVHTRFPQILERTDEFTFKHHSSQLFKELTRINVMDTIVDYQFKSLALLIKKDIKFYEKALDIFFGNSTDTLKYYILHTFCNLDLDTDNLIKMHILFTERFLQYTGTFELIIQKQIEVYANKGIKLLSKFM